MSRPSSPACFPVVPDYARCPSNAVVSRVRAAIRILVETGQGKREPRAPDTFRHLKKGAGKLGPENWGRGKLGPKTGAENWGRENWGRKLGPEGGGSDFFFERHPGQRTLLWRWCDTVGPPSPTLPCADSPPNTVPVRHGRGSGPLKIRAAYSFVRRHLPFLKVLLGEPRARRFSSPPVAMRSAAHCDSRPRPAYFANRINTFSQTPPVFRKPSATMKAGDTEVP